MVQPRVPALLLLGCILLGMLSGCAREASAESRGAMQTIQNKGSDTLVNLALAWAERYATVQPQVQIAVTGGGSGTGLAALMNGTVDLANSSRRIKEEEIAQARANGVEPVEHIVAGDAIAVVVNPRNPVDRLTIPQLAAIFSGQITNWSELGGEDRPIVRLSREVNSGTHVYFLEEVIRQGSPDDKTLFSPETLLMPSSEGISSEIRRNPNAIGYDGLGYVTHDQKVIAIASSDEGPYVLPTAATVRDGSYPIARSLYAYTVGEASGALKGYLEWIATAEAQQIVLELGFVPI
ncbi:MAG: PstS family phosphate ABC transporter substrate-binding protein, partial [Chloroflexi bacterium]|nr:PstS family phosphate ABC transporter substrate-binding protein [Chloroflexota bacterium]